MPFIHFAVRLRHSFASVLFWARESAVLNWAPTMSSPSRICTGRYLETTSWKNVATRTTCGPSQNPSGRSTLVAASGRVSTKAL